MATGSNHQEAEFWTGPAPGNLLALATLYPAPEGCSWITYRDYERTEIPDFPLTKHEVTQFLQDRHPGRWVWNTIQPCPALTMHPDLSGGYVGEIVILEAVGLEMIRVIPTINPERTIQEACDASPVPLQLVLTMPGSPKLDKAFDHRWAYYRRHGDWYDVGLELRQWLKRMKQT